MEKLNDKGKGVKNSSTAHQNPSNGKAVEGGKDKALLQDKPGAEPSAETPKVEPPIVVLSVDDKIRRVEQLNEAIEKRSLLKSHLARVESLGFGDFDERESITIGSQSGNYNIKSASLVKEIAELVKTRIQEQIAIVEEQISF